MQIERALPISEISEDHALARRRYCVIVLCGLVMFLDGLDTQSISYMAPTISKEWSLSREMIGVVFSSALAGSLIGYLFLAPLSDKFGHRRIMIISTLAFAIFSALSAMASSIMELVALRFLTGIGLGAVIPCAVALTSEYAPSRFRASYILLIYCGFSLGFVAAGALAAWLLPVQGWRCLFWIGAVAPLVLCWPLWTYLPGSLEAPLGQKLGLDTRAFDLDRGRMSEYRTASGSYIVSSVFRLFSEGRALGTALLWAAFFLNLAIFYALQSWLPSILTSLHYPLTKVALVTTMTTVGGIAAAVVIGPAMDRLGPFRSVSIILFLGVLVLAFMGTALRSPDWVLLTTAFFTGVCISGGQKSLIALSALFYPSSSRSTGVGWAIGIGRVGGIGGPLLPGLFLSFGFNENALFYVLAGAMLVAGGLTATIGLSYRTR